ncbi:MAG: hypothetical protein JWO98_535 [Frankiales bacterium]|nr:hypothetical protein [Frankiales bacterium]
METDMAELRGPLPGLLRREAAQWWWVPLVSGIVWLLISWVVLRLNVSSVATVGVLLGVVFLYAALTEGMLASLMSGAWRVLRIAVGVLFVLGAIWCFVRPVNSVFALATVLGLLLILQGASAIVQGAAMRGLDSSGWVQLFFGVLTVLLGLWVSTSDRVWTLAARVVFIVLFVGFMAIFRGISDIVLSFQLRQVGQDGTGRGRTAAFDGGTGAHIPSQSSGSARHTGLPTSRPQ